MASCPSCQAENPDGFRFCGACGAPLPLEASREQRERRVVSVLFADLVGFTSRSDRADVEDVDAFVTPYVRLLRRGIERHGGVVCKVMGDGVMALFGAPTTHEDDPERAVRAGLAVCRGVAEEGGLHVRVGVTSGEALVTIDGAGAVDALGDVVNTASRLESAAPVGGVLVDGRTYRATSRAIRFDAADAVEAKGKSEPVACWRAMEPRSIVPEQARTNELTLVGREFEVGLLRGLLDRSAAEPSTQLVSIIGAPGIGKSRLVAELSDQVEARPGLTTWRIGRCLSYGEGIAFWALGEIVKSQAGILESDGAEGARGKLAGAVRALIESPADAEWVTARLAPLLGLEGAGPDAMADEGGRVEAFAAWRRFFEAVAEDGPAVVVFEDTHWADDALLDFIDMLADRAGAIPLLIVCTARPELLQRRPHWGGGKPNAMTISLSPLSAKDTARLIGELLDRAVLPAEVQQGLLERAEGNPLYAQEYVRMLQDRGLLTRDAGGWALGPSAEALPESIQGIIAARLDTLSAEEKSLIQDASVVGRTAWIGAVCSITERSQAAAEELLYALERRQLLQRMRRSTIDGETEFTFGHSLTRDVTYGQIARAERADKHEAAAAWIERLATGREDKAELLADHYSQTIAIRAQLDEDSAALTPRARAAFTEAGRQAASTYAHPAAARHYRAALRLTPADATHERAPLLLAEAVALANAGAADVAVLEAARDAHLDIEAWEQAARAELLISDWYAYQEGSAEQADGHLARAAELVARVPPCEVTFLTANTKAYRMVAASDFDGAIALTSEMIPPAKDAGIDVGVALMQEWRGFSRVQTGDPGGIEDMRAAAETLARRSQSRTANAYNNLGDALLGLGDLAGAHAATSEGRTWGVRLGQTSNSELYAGNLAHMAYLRGDWRQAERLATSLRSTSPLDELPLQRNVQRIALARCEAVSHAVAEALIDYGVESRDDELLYMGLALEVLALRATGDLDRAGATADRFLARWMETGGRLNSLAELVEVSAVLAALERHDDIRAAATLIPDASVWRAPLLALAERRYGDAAEGFQRMEALTLAAEAHLLAVKAGEPGPHADAVREFADARGARLFRDLLAVCDDRALRDRSA